MLHRLLIVALALGASASIPAQVIHGPRPGSAAAPARKALRYVNPLPVNNSLRIGDPMVIRFQEKYYLYLSGGMAWSSDDLVNWEHHPVTLPPGRRVGAPHVLVYDGWVYLTGNNVGLFRSREPLGPFEFMGDFTDGKGNPIKPGSGGGVFDAMLLADDDKRVYLYFSGRSVNGIWGVELDNKDLTKFIGAPKHFFKLEASHAWENFGSANEYQGVGWLEAPWMTKRNGTYYLQYSGSGTDWKTYAVGVQTGKSPLGPFTYSKRSPLLVHRNGMINGTGHHCIIEAPDGTVWALYTLLYRNWNRMFERRIGMDPVGWDEQGNMIFGGPSETPQWGPGVKPRPWQGNDSGSLPLTEDKSYTVSSEAPGHYAPYAFDGSARTWWAPAEGDAQPSLTLDLGSAQPEDPIQEFIIDSSRILFTIPSAPRGERPVTGPRRYKIEVSLDKKTFKTVLDKTGNTADNVVEFDEIAPVQCKWVRLTITGWPRNAPVGVLEFTVFGKPVPARPH